MATNDVTDRFLDVYNYLVDTKSVINSTDFAKKIGITVSLMSEITHRRSNVGVKAIQNTVINFTQIDSEWLLSGTGSMLKSPHKIQKSFSNPDEEWAIKTHGIPLLSLEAFAGLSSGLDTGVKFDEVEERYFIPLFEGKGVDFLISVRGSSMYPTFGSGDVVACSFVHEILFIQWNKVYVINTISQGTIIKRLKKSIKEEHVMCRSDNKEFDDFEVPLKDIRNIGLVLGLIRLE